MEIILILLTGTLMSGFLFLSYRLGFKHGSEAKEKDGYIVSDENKELLKQYANFVSFDGNER